MSLKGKIYLHHEMDRGAKEAGGKRIRIHDLRHSHISLLIDMGFSAVAIADRVGHTGRIGHTIEYLSGVAAKVSDGGGGGSVSEEGFYPLPIFAEAGGSRGLFRRRRIAGRYVPEI